MTRIITRFDGKMYCHVCDNKIQQCSYCERKFNKTDDIFCDESEILHYCEHCFNKMLKEIE